MGRRPIGHKAMTPTEYQRRWRAKRRATDAAKRASRAARMTAMAETLHASQQLHPAAHTPSISAGNSSASLENIAPALACYEAYRMFKDEMAAIAEANYESDQLRVTAILGSVIMLIAHDLPAARSFHALYAHFSHIYDLAFSGRQKPKFAHSAQGLLATTYAALVGPGRKKPAYAIKWLNKKLKEYKLDGLVGAKDIQGWHHQVTAERGKPAPMLAETFRCAKAELSNVTSLAEADAFAAQLLRAIAIGRPHQLKLRSQSLTD